MYIHHFHVKLSSVKLRNSFSLTLLFIKRVKYVLHACLFILDSVCFQFKLLCIQGEMLKCVIDYFYCSFV